MEMIQEITTPSVTAKSNVIPKLESNSARLLLTKSGCVSMICYEVNAKYNTTTKTICLEEPCPTLMMAKRLWTCKLLLESQGAIFASFLYYAYFAYF
jgi:hypothetical protein